MALQEVPDWLLDDYRKLDGEIKQLLNGKPDSRPRQDFARPFRLPGP